MKVTTEVTNFVRGIKSREHAIIFYDSEEAKRSILFPYLSDGLSKNKGVLYICSDESPEQIQDGLNTYLTGGLDVHSEKVQIKNYDQWYIRDGVVEPLKIIDQRFEAHRFFEDRGLGLRVIGETSCFFRKGLVRDLLRYEYALHKILNVEMDAICAYDLRTIVDTGYEDVIMPIIRAHGNALFLAHGGSIVIEPEVVEDTDVEKLLDIKIH